MAFPGLNRVCRIICKTTWALKIYEQIYADIYGSRESMRVSAESMDLLLPVWYGEIWEKYMGRQWGFGQRVCSKSVLRAVP